MLLANVGGVVVAFDHAHVWVTRSAIAAVVSAWCWIIFQTIKSRRAPTRSAAIMMVVATVLTSAAASWPLIEPLAFHALGIAKKHPAGEGRIKMSALSLFGLLAVTSMLVCYALEDHSQWYKAPGRLA